jgi:hypothetical protein
VILTGPSGSVVDVHMSLILQDGETPSAVLAAVGGATIGKIYVRALDSNETGLLVPLSYPTI